MGSVEAGPCLLSWLPLALGGEAVSLWVPRPIGNSVGRLPVFWCSMVLQDRVALKGGLSPRKKKHAKGGEKQLWKKLYIKIERWEAREKQKTTVYGVYLIIDVKYSYFFNVILNFYCWNINFLFTCKQRTYDKKKSSWAPALYSVKNTLRHSGCKSQC